MYKRCTNINSTMNLNKTWTFNIIASRFVVIVILYFFQHHIRYSCAAKLKLDIHINIHTVHDAYKWVRSSPYNPGNTYMTLQRYCFLTSSNKHKFNNSFSSNIYYKNVYIYFSFLIFIEN